ncbi:PspC domain-containing protein [Marivirga atlantica]|jgi:phage shock protein PspC (stress-responsive transcriptional regulator)|uniref:PspC family transcriptional regulator n=1 Tax=Marivirga atlantica TaxID=1548457 RepID=A0A937AB14_9BACT|nr:PspC family transcriptional regulator [Marivirga atlantica]MBL0765555.1 PspC family transcriptional regulator [Marivirga atlantica]
MKKVQQFIENQAFGVCTRLGEILEIPTSHIRLFFVYTSFLTFGSPILIYLGLAFIRDFRKLLRRGSSKWYY